MTTTERVPVTLRGWGAPAEPGRAMVAAAWASVVANVVIVLTGGAVRLTGSGLGCPTWPRCTDTSYTPHGAWDLHQRIEFGNRMLTFALVAVAVLTYVVAYRVARRTGRSDLTTMAFVLAMGVPLQAVVGGVSVLVDLNPWVVSLHLLLSLAMIALAVRLVHAARRATPLPAPVPSVPGRLAPLLAAACAAVLYLGTVVTGSGPHAGDEDAPRNGLDPLQTSQLHADLVFALLGLTVALLLVAERGTALRRAAGGLLAVELAQGTVGFVQYFTGLPEWLVEVHLLGSALVTIATAHVVIEARRAPAQPRQPASSAPRLS